MADAEAQAIELRQQLRAKLKSLLVVASDVDSTLKDVNQIQNELDVEGKPINLLKSRLERSYDRINTEAAREMSFIQDAMTTLDSLMSVQAKLPPVETSEPGGYKRVGGAAATGQQPASSRKRQRESDSTGPAVSAATTVSTPSPTSTPPLTRKPSARSKRDLLMAQLPLVEGRPVAFKPAKEGWILARVLHMVGTDKNKYVVQDVDSSGPDGVYTATMKSIVPLPDTRDRARTYPDSDIAPGTPVMALFPDTTSFYRAVVQGGPSPEKGKRRERVYQVKFDDDDDVNRPIPVELVYEVV